MSVRAIAWAWAVAGLPPPQKLVLLRLADTARDDGAEAWRATARMVEETGLSERTVRTALRGLEARGLIRVDRPADPGRKLTTVYSLPVSTVDQRNTENTPATDAPLQGRELPPSAVTGAGAAPVGGQELPDRGARAAPSPYYLRTESPEESHSSKIELNSDTVEAMFAIYREVLGEILPVPREITRKRASAAATRLRDSCGGDIEVWRHVCGKVAASRFLTGGGERGWKADIDWLLRRDNLLKLSEGKYDNRAGGGPGSLLDAINNSSPGG